MWNARKSLATRSRSISRPCICTCGEKCLLATESDPPVLSRGSLESIDGISRRHLSTGKTPGRESENDQTSEVVSRIMCPQGRPILCSACRLTTYTIDSLSLSEP